MKIEKVTICICISLIVLVSFFLFGIFLNKLVIHVNDGKMAYYSKWEYPHEGNYIRFENPSNINLYLLSDIILNIDDGSIQSVGDVFITISFYSIFILLSLLSISLIRLGLK